MDIMEIVQNIASQTMWKQQEFKNNNIGMK